MMGEDWAKASAKIMRDCGSIRAFLRRPPNSHLDPGEDMKLALAKIMDDYGSIAAFLAAGPCCHKS